MRSGKSMLVFLLVILILFFSSCSSKFYGRKAASESNSNNIRSNLQNDLKTSFSENEDIVAIKASPAPQNTSETFLSSEALFKKETEQLAALLNPYTDPTSQNFAGKENSEYLKDCLLKPENLAEPMSTSDWERVVRILFKFNESDDEWIKMYLSGFDTDGRIERQYAVSGIMKLLSLRYPISLGGGQEIIEQSDNITDLKTIDDRHQFLIRQAFCLHLTDISVESSGVFRPSDPLTRGEAVSMINRILTQYGLLTQDEHDASSNNPEKTASPDLSANTQSSTVEIIQKEYEDFKESLKANNSGASRQKLDCLAQAEAIIGLDFKNSSVNDLLTLDQWRQLLHEVFGLDNRQIEPYLSYETSGTLPYDVAAISIFKLSFLFGGYDCRDATAEELEKARAAIPQFDTARDISKLAQMYASGLLDGLNEMPGFTPQRPVTKAEAIILVKRMIEDDK